MDIIEMICFYLKGYLLDEELKHIFYGNLEKFEEGLGEQLYLEMISTNFTSKESKISLRTMLKGFIDTKYPEELSKINDGYLELLLKGDSDGEVIKILKKKCEKRGEIIIDCSSMAIPEDLMRIFKEVLGFPAFCGNSWESIEDLLFDVLFPEKLIFKNWSAAMLHMPMAAARLKEMLDYIKEEQCMILYQ